MLRAGRRPGHAAAHAAAHPRRPRRARGWRPTGCATPSSSRSTAATGIVGVLVVADRLGDVRTFGEDDVLLLETVANHAGVALRNGELIGQLRHDSLHDALTGLPNRTDLQRRLTAALSDAVADGTSRRRGHDPRPRRVQAGQRDARPRAGRPPARRGGAPAGAAVGTAGTVARLGGDEFAVLLPDNGGRGAGPADRTTHPARPRAADRARRPRGGDRRLGRRRPRPGARDRHRRRCSSGPTWRCTTPRPPTRGLRLYEPELDTDSPRRLTLVSELRAALQNGELEVHVQPKAGCSDGQVVGVEALVRWQHPELGWVAPGGVHPGRRAQRSHRPAHDPGARHVAGRLRAVARGRPRPRRRGEPLHPQPARRRPGRAGRAACCAGTASRPTGSTLEVTEGAVMADPDARRRACCTSSATSACACRSTTSAPGTRRCPTCSGCRSRRSRSTAASSPVWTTPRENFAIVRAIIDLGRHLGLEVVAEGVEDEATWDAAGGHGLRPGPGLAPGPRDAGRRTPPLVDGSRGRPGVGRVPRLTWSPLAHCSGGPRAGARAARRAARHGRRDDRGAGRRRRALRRHPRPARRRPRRHRRRLGAGHRAGPDRRARAG